MTFKMIFVKRALVLFFLTGLILPLSSAAFAQSPEKTRFFGALYDVPIMPGLEEAPDQAVLFDKPDGRIAEAVATTRTLSAARIEDFYAESLPQLGWKKTASGYYQREGESLRYTIEKKPPLTIVRFALEPSKSLSKSQGKP